MAISISEFWKLAVASGLLDPERCQELHAEFSGLKGASKQASASSLALWLVANGTLSRYQASILAAGRPGPFVFGDFVIVERIESGRLARFFKVAYKNNQPLLFLFAAQLPGGDGESSAEIAQGARQAMAIRSPYVSLLHRFVPGPPHAFLIVQNLEGRSLRERLAGGRLSPAAACKLGAQVALGLAAMHEQQSPHGRIYPENIWIDPAGNAKILQFPLVTPPAPVERLELPLADYAAPELIGTRLAATELGDIYSLGCTLFELVAASVPFPGGNAQEKLNRHRTQTLPRIDNVAGGVSSALADLIAEMTDANPLQRLQSAADVARRLQALTPRASGGPAEPAAPIPPAPPEMPAVDEDDVAMADEPFDAALAPPKRPPSSNTALIGAAAALALLIVVVIAGLMMANRGEETKPAPATEAASAAETGAPHDDRQQRGDDAIPLTGAATPPAKPTVVETTDDARLLWASPTAGEPLNLDYVPSSALVIVVLRPAEILTTSEGPKLLDSLGPAGSAAQSELRAILGVELAQIEQLSIAFVADDAGAVQPAFVMRLVEAIPEATLLTAWGNPTAAQRESKRYFAGPRFAYYFPEAAQGRLVVIAGSVSLGEIITRDGPPLLRQAIEDLARASDSSRQFNLLFSPSFLRTDGRSLMAGELEKLRAPLARFFDESIEAVLVSAHLGDSLFLELRAVARAERRPAELAGALRSRLEKAGEQVENYVTSLAPAPYGRLIVNRFPRMVQLLGDFTRSGVEDGQAVLRAYLPAAALHNLLLGAELTLWEQPAATAAGVSSERSPATPRPAGAAAALQKKVTLSFPRDTLEHALEMLAKEIDVEIVILGPDLQLEGITKNQSFALDERERPAAEILRKVLKLASAEGKLVYVIKPKSGSGEAIFITTPKAAAKRGDRLPAEFDPKNRQDQP